MWKAAAFIACAVVAGAAAGQAQPLDGTAEDDLAVVKRAVEKNDDHATPRAQARRTDKARWFRVRIEERNGAKVRVNLPLDLVRDIEHELPGDWSCGRWHRGCKMRLGEVLDLLDAGEDIVEIKDADATVRIWVE